MTELFIKNRISYFTCNIQYTAVKSGNEIQHNYSENGIKPRVFLKRHAIFGIFTTIESQFASKEDEQRETQACNCENVFCDYE